MCLGAARKLHLCGRNRKAMERVNVPQAEGQQSPRLLVEFQVDALQLSSSHQFMGNNGR